MQNTTEQIYDFLLEYEIATQNEISLVCSINGTNKDSLNSIIYCRTGYHSMKQLIESLIKLSQCDLKRMREEGRMHLNAIWNLLGQPTQEAFKPKAKNEQ